jgi:ATP-dependent Lon protease
MDVLLFPLVNVTLFPGTTKPINVFEARYVAMIKESIKKNLPIALGFIENPEKIITVKPGESVSFVRDVAGYGYAQIIEERPNGSLLVFMQGRGKLRLGEVVDSGSSYIVCKSELIPEVVVVDQVQQTKLIGIFRILSRWVQNHIEDAKQQEIFLKNLIRPEEIIGSFASYLIRDYDMQQMVLEYNDINEKIGFIYRLIESDELTN